MDQGGDENSSFHHKIVIAKEVGELPVSARGDFEAEVLQFFNSARKAGFFQRVLSGEMENFGWREPLGSRLRLKNKTIIKILVGRLPSRFSDSKNQN